MYSINQSMSQILRNHTIFTALGTFGIAYVGYSLFANLNFQSISNKYITNKNYQNKIHKEIKHIIVDYCETANIDQNTNKQISVFTLNNFQPDKEWKIDFSNKEMVDAIDILQNKFSLSNISITVSNYPYYNRIILERDGVNDIKLRFDD